MRNLDNEDSPSLLPGFIEEVMENDELSEDDRHCLEVAYRNATRLARLIDDLLIVGEADIGSARIWRWRRRLWCRCGTIVSLFAATALRAQNTLTSPRGDGAEPPADHEWWCAIADQERLEQTLTNLVSNALKFTPPGGQVSVELGRDDQHSEHRVTDTGSGIKADALDRVFDRLFRAQQDVGVKGTGLGLAIARQGPLHRASQPPTPQPNGTVLPTAASS